jgi:large subunit ribosomal protein L25
VALTDRVKTRVPLHLIGEAAGLKQAGAILLHPTNELEVECVVTEIPEFLEVNIATLDVGHAITVSEVDLPSDSIKVLTDKNHIVAQIVIQQETVVAEATAAGTGPAEPEVLTAKKPAEGDAAGAKPAAGGKAAAPAKDAKAPAAPKK